MTSVLTLSELGEQYLKEAEEIDKQIKSYTSRLHKAFSEEKNEEVLRLRRLLRMLYEQRSELRFNGKFLSEYYDKTKRRYNGKYFSKHGRGRLT